MGATGAEAIEKSMGDNDDCKREFHKQFRKFKTTFPSRRTIYTVFRSPVPNSSRTL